MTKPNAILKINFPVDGKVTPNAMFYYLMSRDNQMVLDHYKKLFPAFQGSAEDALIDELVRHGYIVEGQPISKTKLTKKQVASISEDMINLYEAMIKEFRRSNLPRVECTKKEFAARMSLFMSEYGEYSKEQIIEATKLYVNETETNGFKYIKNLIYFIFKHENGIRTSTLAARCELVSSGTKVEQTKPVRLL